MDNPAFPLQVFYSRFPEFDSEDYGTNVVLNAGQRAMMHVTKSELGMPLFHMEHRQYALFLMTAHLLTLDKSDRDNADGGTGTGLAGLPFKATVGSVSIENTKPNTFTSDDWTYWLSQTKYGRELLAYLEVHATPIFLNTPEDSVRDLL